MERWQAHLLRIEAMRFNWIYLNPLHETGYSGSLYAVKDYYRLNPLFRGDAREPDDALIRRFVDRAAARGMRVMTDLVINHTARDAVLMQTRPDWYLRDQNGGPVSPTASDPADPSNVVVWTDLAELDYRDRPERDEMIAYFSDVVRHYLSLGVRGFRCDAAYKIPAEVWQRIIANARDASDDVVFAAENLGAPLEDAVRLQSAGFDYLFNSSKWWDFRADWLLEQYALFRRVAPSISFPESHDTPRLRSEEPASALADPAAYYRFRYLFAAFFSSGVMLPIGYEYGANEKLDVVMTRPEHLREPSFDISPFIGRVNAMKAALPALNEEGPQRIVFRDDALLALERRSSDERTAVIALINPQDVPAKTIDAALLADAFGADARFAEITPGLAGEPPNAIALGPFDMRLFASTPSSAPAPIAALADAR
jgi:starch synthase (maltosyl-transferring)